MVVEGNFVPENLCTVWARIARRYNVLSINVSLDIRRVSRKISTLGTLVLPAIQESHHGFNPGCKMELVMYFNSME